MVIDSSDKPEYALPGTSYKKWPSVAVKPESSREHTFSVKPQKRTSGFPFREDTALEKPLGCSLVVSTTRNVVVSGRIWRREPSVKVLSQLVSCENS
jgi:hypothetical protein